MVSDSQTLCEILRTAPFPPSDFEAANVEKDFGREIVAASIDARMRSARGIWPIFNMSVLDFGALATGPL